MKEKYVLKIYVTQIANEVCLKMSANFSWDKVVVIKMLKNDVVLSWKKQSMFQMNDFWFNWVWKLNSSDKIVVL
jgi:hypothetical protein